MKQPPSRSILLVARGLDPVGTGRQVELAAEGFREAGYDVHLAFTTTGGATPGRLKEAGFAVHRVGRRGRVDCGAFARLALVSRRLRPAVLHACGRSQAVLAAAARPLVPGARLVCQVALGPRDAATARALRHADRVITVSAAVAGRCEAWGVKSGRIDIIPPGIAAAADRGLTREQIASALGLRTESPWTLCVAPLVAEARLDRLLWAIDQLEVVHRGVEHVLVGSGPLERRLLRRARAQQLAQRLHLVPQCEFLPDLLKQVRLVWQSGDVAYGGAILDAMPLGIPSIAVDGDTARQLIADDQTGRIVPVVPESELPRRAMNVIEDDALRARYSAAARVRAEELFAIGGSIARQVAVVERVL
ncbi:MAG: glycosyltransferase family 4 protein [Planctomycetia bacterium]|jgi:glycosyltransferase involved in cell wall biosynthesis